MRTAQVQEFFVADTCDSFPFYLNFSSVQMFEGQVDMDFNFGFGFFYIPGGIPDLCSEWIEWNGY